jgi:hemerythrin-like domain-containing protein
MQTTMDSRQLTHPIDAMLLIHKALRAEAIRAEEAVDALEMGGSFKPFQRVFYRWAMALGYHVEVEDHYFTTWFPDTPLAQAQEGGPGQVIAMLEDLQTYLHTDLGRMIVIPRTQRQLRSKVIALGIVQDDLLEEEEGCVLPVIQQSMSTAQQLDLIRHLLMDEEAEEQRDMPDWVAQDLTTTEQQWLADLCGGHVPAPRHSSLHWRSDASLRQQHMAEDMTALDSPIDVMYPLHKALRAEAAHAEETVRALGIGDSFQPFAQVLQRWATALEYHAVVEDQYMTAALTRPSARTNEAEHRGLSELFADLWTYLRKVEGPATARTRRHVLGKVVMLRVAQDDHLEEEEERLLPMIRQQLSDVQQYDIAQRLLIDRQAQNIGWPLTWLSPYVTATERQLLTDLVGQTRRDEALLSGFWS